MKITLEKKYAIDAPVENSWAFLQDIKAVAECMPGAEITEKIDSTHYKGIVKVKLGPIKMAFNGDFNIANINDKDKELHLLGKGMDNKGTSSVKMDLVAQVCANNDNQSALIARAEVTVTGKLASFGGRMLTQVSEQILKQFSQQFISQVLALDSGAKAKPAQIKRQKNSQSLNGLALIWAVLTGFIKNIFTSRSKK